MSASSRRLPPANGPRTSKILGIAAAAGLVPLNSTMIAVALPSVSDDFDVTTGTVTTLITLYLIVMLVGQPLAGRLTDAIGAKKSVLGALIGLAALSFFAAFAPSFEVLVGTRALQAACAAVLSPAAQSLLRSISSPDDQGRVFGILGSVLGAGAALGPVVGGLLVQLFGWQAIFLVNVPIAGLAFLTARRIEVVSATEGDRASVDSSEGRIVNSVFAAGFLAQALSTQTQYALLLLTPIILDARGWDPGPIGGALSALTLGMILVGPIGGRFGDAHGRRLPSVVGLASATAAIAGLLFGGASIPPALLIVALGVFGVGLGATTPNLMSAALGSVPSERTGSAAGILSMSRYVGSIGTSVLISRVVTAETEGTRLVLGVSVVCMLLAVLMTRGLPGVQSRDQAAPSGPTR